MQFLLSNLTTLNHVWSIQLLVKETNQYGPQYAFKMSMFMCPAVHMSTRSLLRSSSTHKPSDPPLRVEYKFFYKFIVNIKRRAAAATTEGFKHNDLIFFGRISRLVCRFYTFWLSKYPNIKYHIKCFHFIIINNE